MLTQLLSPARRAKMRQRAALEPQRVVLVTPPSVFLLDERVFISLGVLKVAAVLERAGHAVEHLDLSGIENYTDVVEAHLGRSSVKVMGITTTTPQLPAVARVVDTVRRCRPDIRVILGGPHVTLVCAAVKLEVKRGVEGRAHRALANLRAMADVLVAGDGEEAIFEALRPDAPPVVDGDDHKSSLFMDNEAYDATPWPARHLVDLASYNYAVDGHRACSLVAQLGCPFGCGFCGGRNSKSLRMIRMRTTENIVAEVEHLHRQHGYTGFMWYDDELSVNRALVELMDALTALQRRLGVEFRMRGFVKAELFTAEHAAAMYRAGFRWVLCGFEAADPRILDNINKRATLEDNTAVVRVAHDAGIKVKALMSVGHPGESEATIHAVRDWLLDVRPDDFDCTCITTYPGTPYYDEAAPHETMADVWTYAAKSGDRLHSFDVDYARVADYYKGDPNGGYKSYVFTDHLSPERLVALRDDVESTVRAKLGIPFNAGAAARRYEHSMGQSELPPFVLRSSAASPGP